MSQNIKIALAVVVGIVIAIVAGAILSNRDAVLGGTVINNYPSFTNGLKAGSSNQLTITSAGVLSAAGITGTTGTFSGAVSGTTGTFTGFGKFGSTASSTVQVGAASKSGCLIIGDSANGASPVYITATGATITATTTKPAACQTVQ